MNRMARALLLRGLLGRGCRFERVEAPVIRPDEDHPLGCCIAGIEFREELHLDHADAPILTEACRNLSELPRP